MLPSMPCDWKALSKRIGYADVAFTLRQTDPSMRTSLLPQLNMADCSLMPAEYGESNAFLHLMWLDVG